jgi:2-octaprenylphenol hydroxylase
MRQFDVIVVGGGIVGLTTACALGEKGITVAVVEAREAPPGGTSVEPGPRVYAITRASQQIFSALGVWEEGIARGAYPFREMQVWDAGGSGTIHFDCADIGEPYLGHMLDPGTIQAALWQRAEALPAVTLVYPAPFHDVAFAASLATVSAGEGEPLGATLVVGADGVHSPLRGRLGIHTRTHDYRQSSLVARVRTERDHRDTAWQRFLPGGPLAFLPVADGWSSIVWTMPAAAAQEMQVLDKAAFHEALGEAFGFRLGAITGSGPRELHPLRRLHADHYVRERAALVGDAAHAIHPLAGQGINLGLLDAATLAEVVLEARDRQRDIGSLPVLRRYERWRRGDNLLMMSIMDGFNHLFSNRLPVLGWVRNLGLTAVDVARPAKDRLMRHAMGLAGDLPALARRPAVDR